ncbi:MAG: LAGLIDADG family homing endonuclease [Patescibacteria group bacterium]
MKSRRVGEDKKLQAYIIGVALGDGNLSNPNGRAVRLRITCDKKYPQLLKHITESLKILFPESRVGIVNRKGCVDVSIYSNKLTKLLGWQWDKGPKDAQNVRVPTWIKRDTNYLKECLRGLFQTDGSQYNDRGYPMINFVNTCETLAADVSEMIKILGYYPNVQRLKQDNGKIRYTVRLAKNTTQFIKTINYWKV